MAVRPQDIIQDIEREVDILEQEIDIQLKKVKVYNETGVTIDAPKTFRYHHLPSLRERYKKAGWIDVIYKDDQRDGSALIFKIR